MTPPRLKRLIGSTTIIVALGFMLFDSLSQGEVLEYSYEAKAVLQEPTRFEGRRIRVQGYVYPGSIYQKRGTLQYQFFISPTPQPPGAKPASSVLHAEYEGVVPDTFKDGAQVTASGRLSQDGIFVAQEVIAKCPSKYEAQEKNAGTY